MVKDYEAIRKTVMADYPKEKQDRRPLASHSVDPAISPSSHACKLSVLEMQGNLHIKILQPGRLTGRLHSRVQGAKLCLTMMESVYGRALSSLRNKFRSSVRAYFY